MTAVAAIDLGATSGRVLTGSLDSGALHLHHVARFPNTPVRITDGLHWDVLALYLAAMTGLGKASREAPLIGAAIDSWAVDYGLLRGNRLLGNPYHYRDDRNASGVEAVHRHVGPEELFRRNGLQHLPFNTIFQLAAAAATGALEAADRFLLVPDLLGFWATGTEVAERTNASTTGLLSIESGDWDLALMPRLPIRDSMLPPLVDPGYDLGPVTAEVRDEFGIADGLHFTTVGSHDTASAVVGVPLQQDGSAFISSGTWSLVGAELAQPVTSDEARLSGFTNEGGVDGRVRFLKNVMGLWLLSESIRTWQRSGGSADLGSLLAQAAQVPADVPTFDVNDSRLLAPGDMPSRIENLLREDGRRSTLTRAELTRSVLQSLANAYRDAVDDIERLTGRSIRTINLVGGGAQNALLCQLTADTAGRPVLAGPIEATAIGNVLVQLRTHGELTGGLEDLRLVVARSFPPHRYEPRTRTQKG